jgi:hypothetical protein
MPVVILQQLLHQELLPEFERKWHSRKERSLPESIQFAQAKFARIWASDGSTLEAVFRKLDSLTEVPKNQLAGKIGVVLVQSNRTSIAVRNLSTRMLPDNCRMLVGTLACAAPAENR